MFTDKLCLPFYESLHVFAQIILGCWYISHWLMFSLQSKDMNLPSLCTPTLSPTLPLSLFSSHLHWLSLICTWAAPLTGFIGNYSVKPVAVFAEGIFEDNVAYTSFLLMRAHKRHFFLITIPGIIMLLLSSGFIFMLWTQWTMELIMSSLHHFLKKVKSTAQLTTRKRKHFKSTFFVHLISFLVLF